MQHMTLMRASFVLALIGGFGCGPQAGSTARQTAVEPAAASPTVALACRDALVGAWIEEFSGRSGCKDTYRIQAAGDGLAISGRDCNDNVPYKIGAIEFTCKRLRFDIQVLATGYVLSYQLASDSAVMRGKVIVYRPNLESDVATVQLRRVGQE